VANAGEPRYGAATAATVVKAVFDAPEGVIDVTVEVNPWTKSASAPNAMGVMYLRTFMKKAPETLGAV
jgi:hypothetical protein